MNDDLNDPITYLRVVRDQLIRIEKAVNTIRNIAWALLGGLAFQSLKANGWF